MTEQHYLHRRPTADGVVVCKLTELIVRYVASMASTFTQVAESSLPAPAGLIPEYAHSGLLFFKCWCRWNNKILKQLSCFARGGLNLPAYSPVESSLPQ